MGSGGFAPSRKARGGGRVGVPTTNLPAVLSHFASIQLIGTLPITVNMPVSLHGTGVYPLLKTIVFA
jgi:hypothetical protein